MRSSLFSYFRSPAGLSDLTSKAKPSAVDVKSEAKGKAKGAAAYVKVPAEEKDGGDGAEEEEGEAEAAESNELVICLVIMVKPGRPKSLRLPSSLGLGKREWSYPGCDEALCACTAHCTGDALLLKL